MPISVNALSSWSGGTLPLLTRSTSGPTHVARADCLQGEDQVPHVAAEVELPAPQRRQPHRLQFAGRQPQGVVEKLVHRPVESCKRQLHGSRLCIPASARTASRRTCG